MILTIVIAVVAIFILLWMLAGGLYKMSAGFVLLAIGAYFYVIAPDGTFSLVSMLGFVQTYTLPIIATGLGHFIVGGLYSLLRWRGFAKTNAGLAVGQFNDFKAKNPSTTAEEFKASSWNPINPRNHKAQLAWWAVGWEFYVAWMILHSPFDWTISITKFIGRSLYSTYKRMSDTAFDTEMNRRSK